MILSIESSCDDSSLALTRIQTREILFHQKISQDTSHAKYGGVVPEIASRLHSVHLPKILQRLSDSFDLRQVRAIAVTTEPGLSVSLLEGVMMAKALSLALNAQLIAVNHLQGHIYSLFLGQKAIFPLSILLLSGGHSLIIEAQSHTELKIIATTLDDSFGEAFDKVAKMLSLGYPGGAIVESCAKNAVQKNINFPVPLSDSVQSKNIAFSFSGLKNAVRLKIEELDSLNDLGKSAESHSQISQSQINEICYAFQKSAIAHIIQKTRLYFERECELCESQRESAESSKSGESKIRHFGVVGGASANLALRAELQTLAQKFNKEILFAPLEFCSDNAAMIGRCAVESYHLGEFTALENLSISPKSTRF